MTLNYMLNKFKKEIILINENSLSSLDTFKHEMLEELKIAKYNDLEDRVYRFQLKMVKL